jgi:SAM-dependent methyltransferase
MFTNWEQRYQDENTPWDLGQPAPPFVSLLQSSEAPQPGRALFPGCGRGHDALWFAENGFEVVGVDFAPSAIAAATATAQAQQLPAQFLQRDFFDLTPEYAQQFDYVVEHTCFCAIDPELRSAYVNVVRELLKPGGELIGLFFTHGRSGGPPYGSTPADIRNYFTPSFTLQSLVPVTNSVPSRQGEEHLGRFRLL